jgi:glycosyltransferase involved in cell wall biosynthesis
MKKENKLITVIVPVYNGEKYISRCVDSILNQTKFPVENIEILLINDGSRDGSINILKSYQTKFPNLVSVIDQPNSGVAKTRNKGIALAKGKYVIFIDQDDYINSDFCSIYYRAAESGDYDVVVGGYKRPNDKGEYIRKVSQPNTEYSIRYKISAAWAKIHNVEFLRTNNIEFYNNNYGEDIIFTMAENNKTTKILGIDYFGYNWFWNSASVSNTSQRGLKENIKIRELLLDMIPHAKTELDMYYLVQTGVHYLLFSGRSAVPGDFVKLYKSIFSIYDDNKVNYSKNKYIFFGPSGALLSVRLAVSGFVLLHRLNLIGIFAKIYCNGSKK